jgi:hypothetical protein
LQSHIDCQTCGLIGIKDLEVFVQFCSDDVKLDMLNKGKDYGGSLAFVLMVVHRLIFIAKEQKLKESFMENQDLKTLQSNWQTLVVSFSPNPYEHTTT